ncbi:hypothetical protein V1503_19255 [Bacillus sp. SCS-151]|uniref:hypothetical protein n=1 Tax=Nanhaiella sioensis TaxID=3115293 RepID=UPI00397B19AD
MFMENEIVGSTTAYFLIHQFIDEKGKSCAEVLERLTNIPENEYDGAFDCLETELSYHLHEDRFSVLKVEAKLVTSYCWDYGVYEYDEELSFEEVDFNAML